MLKTLVCDIQRFSVHDGPGIRTTVFFKGCMLRCKWCQNPETLRFDNEIIYSADKCIACADCAKVCNERAIVFDRFPIFNYDSCKACLACTEVCPSRAIEPAAKEYTAEALAKELLADRDFFEPAGGVTLSGGEPYARPGFLIEMLPMLKREKIHIAAETCGHFHYEAALPALKLTDLILYDIKAVNPELHQRLTGIDNKLIHENLKRIIKEGIPHQLRMPLVPGYNDSDSELEDIAKFVRYLGESEIWILPYHKLGESKLKKIRSELKPLAITAHTETQLKAKARIFTSHGLTVKTFNFTMIPE